MQHIPDYRKFVNERINLKASHLSSEDYQKAKKLKAFNSTDWVWNPKSNLYDKVNESLVTEAKFFRLPKQLNAMWELKNSVDSIVGKHSNGDDYNPAEMKTIEEFIKKIKKSAKAFKDASEVKGTIYESVTEKLSSSDFNTVDGLLNDVANYLGDTLPHKEWMGMDWEEKSDVVNNAMSKISDKHIKDKKLTNLVNKKTDDIIDYFVGSLSESVNEGKGQDLADKYVAKLRSEFKKLSDDELNEFKKTITQSLDLNESVNEAKGYYIKVAIRDAKKALSILDDMYRKKFDINGSDTYYFKDEDMAYDAKMDLAARDIEITDTNVEESISEAKIMKDLEKIGGQIDYLSDADDATKKIWKKAGFNTEDDNGNHPTIILYSYVNSWPETKKLLDKSKIKYKELEDPNSAGESFIVFNESVTEAIDINDPVLVAMRAFRMSYLKKGKATPKVKKISTTQYYKLMDREIDIIDQMKDASKEFEQLVSDMNNEAGQKGAEWTDADANRYGGDLDKIQTKIEKLTLQKKKVQDQIKNYRMS